MEIIGLRPDDVLGIGALRDEDGIARYGGIQRRLDGGKLGRHMQGIRASAGTAASEQNATYPTLKRGFIGWPWLVTI
jgi:hypothetical protein